MSEFLNNIIHNAQNGNGACSGCPARSATQGKNVNPGLLSFDAEIMFLTLDPSHEINWNNYENWQEYNQDYSCRFASWRGGKKIQELVAPFDLTLDDVWLGDSVKCPVDNSFNTLDSRVAIDQAADHCNEYLEREVELVGPQVIVPMGEEATQRLLKTVFEISPGSLKTGTRDCGKIYRTDPPVVVSPHWSYGWLDRSQTGSRNLEIVQSALEEVYNSPG